MRDIAVVMITMDRRPSGNYLGRTLENFTRARVWDSPRLHSFHVVDSGSENAVDFIGRYVDVLVSERLNVRLSDRKLVGRENVARALRIGAAQETPWVLFCED